MEELSNIDVSEFIRLAPIGSPETGQEVRPGTSLPRAGGQDDVSLNKLPQNILYIESPHFHRLMQGFIVYIYEGMPYLNRHFHIF